MIDSGAGGASNVTSEMSQSLKTAQLKLKCQIIANVLLGGGDGLAATSDSGLRKSGADPWCCDPTDENKGELAEKPRRSTARSNENVEDELFQCC